MLFQSAYGLDLSNGQENVPITIDGDLKQVEYPAFQVIGLVLSTALGSRSETM